MRIHGAQLAHRIGTSIIRHGIGNGQRPRQGGINRHQANLIRVPTRKGHAVQFKGFAQFDHTRQRKGRRGAGRQIIQAIPRILIGDIKGRMACEESMCSLQHIDTIHARICPVDVLVVTDTEILIFDTVILLTGIIPCQIAPIPFPVIQANQIPCMAAARHALDKSIFHAAVIEQQLESLGVTVAYRAQIQENTCDAVRPNLFRGRSAVRLRGIIHLGNQGIVIGQRNIISRCHPLGQRGKFLYACINHAVIVGAILSRGIRGIHLQFKSAAGIVVAVAVGHPIIKRPIHMQIREHQSQIILGQLQILIRNRCQFGACAL